MSPADILKEITWLDLVPSTQILSIWKVLVFRVLEDWSVCLNAHGNDGYAPALVQKRSFVQ